MHQRKLGIHQHGKIAIVLQDAIIGEQWRNARITVKYYIKARRKRSVVQRIANGRYIMCKGL